jgi:hypothetical protein
MKLWRRKKADPRPDTSEESENEKRSRKNEKRARKEKEKGRQDSANPELAARLREYGENYGLEEDPYLEGLSNAIEEGKNLSVWASNDVMTLMPHPDVESVEGPIYSAMVLIRNDLVFVPVALTWLAVGKATTGFSVYTAKSSAASVVNFLQFWQNGYGVLAKVWTLSHIAEDDFYIIATVITLTFITPFMNRSAVKKAATFEQDALRERLTLVIEVESFLFDKRRLTPLSIDSALAKSFERVVEATQNLAIASKRIDVGLKSLPRQIERDDEEADRVGNSKVNGGRYDSARSAEYDERFANFEDNDDKQSRRARKEEKRKAKGASDSRELVIIEQDKNGMQKRETPERKSESVDQATATLEAMSKRVDVIAQSLPRRAHARKELKKVEIELDQTRSELESLQAKLKKKQKKAQKENEWKAAKREAERNKALSRPKAFKDNDARYLEEK